MAKAPPRELPVGIEVGTYVLVGGKYHQVSRCLSEAHTDRVVLELRRLTTKEHRELTRMLERELSK
jgi:hypothetical protein